MRTSQCAVYQVKETPEYRDVRCSKNDCFIYKPIYRKDGNKKFI